MKEKEGVRFGVVSIINHWVMALLFLSVLGLGFFLNYVGDGRAVRGPWMEVHKAGGVIVLGLALWRIGWRLYQGFPKDLAPMPLWQHLAAKLVHWALIAALVALPVSGILMSLFSERGINVFGLFMIPAQPENIVISSAAFVAHTSLAYLVSFALFLHVGAVFKHHFIEKDQTLIRMLKTNFVTYKPFSAGEEAKKPARRAPPTTKVKAASAPSSSNASTSAKVAPLSAAKRAATAGKPVELKKGKGTTKGAAQTAPPVRRSQYERNI